MFSDFPKFSEFNEERHLQGEKITINQVLNKEVLICDIEIEPSKLKKGETYCKIQIATSIVGDVLNYKVFFSGSKVLAKQITKYKDRLPFVATIIKQDNYYKLT